jgi:predicted hydrolase (HD superfamily)
MWWSLEVKSFMNRKVVLITGASSGIGKAAALILPSKKLSDVDESFILRRMDEKSFARGADREQIKSCKDLGLTLEEFIGISLRAMKKAAGDLGL